MTDSVLVTTIEELLKPGTQAAYFSAAELAAIHSKYPQPLTLDTLVSSFEAFPSLNITGSLQGMFDRLQADFPEVREATAEGERLRSEVPTPLGARMTPPPQPSRIKHGSNDKGAQRG